MQKIISKAYSCNIWDFPGSIVYADTSGKAKSDYLREIRECWEDAEYVAIKACRERDWDLVEQEPDPVINLLSDRQIHMMEHSIGHDYQKAKPYRNYFQSGNPDDIIEWNGVIKLGLAVSWVSGNLQYFGLTDKGIKVINSKHPIPRRLLN